jgi:hypothetical protein
MKLARLSLLEGFPTREGSLNGHRGQKVCTTRAILKSDPRAIGESQCAAGVLDGCSGLKSESGRREVHIEHLDGGNLVQNGT